MDLRRAQEIMESSDTISVLYQNKPVWIENLNEMDNTAQVSYTDTKAGAVVSVNKLVEA